ncbi:hypothetical protein EDB84DRAFT_1588404 [Lactarius hengduanensis]|nr:hypothetical protein EDB84DRAFT_1588404 [Lactarius hengduanensis]
MTMRRRYRGHRAHSFISADVDQLVELRARQRTFNGAYTRTALGNLGYSLAVLRLFDRRFYHIGLLYAFLAVFLCERGQSFGRPFVTAGRIVALVACVVAATELALLALVLRL